MPVDVGQRVNMTTQPHENPTDWEFHAARASAGQRPGWLIVPASRGFRDTPGTAKPLVDASSGSHNLVRFVHRIVVGRASASPI